MLDTRLTSEYGLRTPFVSAGMAFLAWPPLAAAVSNAGGLGMLAGPAPPPILARMIRGTRELTPHPFGVDFIVETSPSLGPFTTAGHIQVCVDERVPVVVFFWNLPPERWIRSLKDAGTRVWFQTSSTGEAQAAVAAGIDVIVAQGGEAGGHNRGTVPLSTLLPQMADAVPVPVIAAGGIADGRGVAEVLALGAAGVWVGTRLIASVEANAHDEYKRRVVAASASDIARTCIFGPEWPDAPMRVIRNRVVREWAGRDHKTPPPTGETIGAIPLGNHQFPMPKFSTFLPTRDATGDFEEMCLPAGDSAALVHEIKPAAEIVAEMMAGQTSP